MINAIYVLESLVDERLTGYELFTDTIVRYNDLCWKEEDKIKAEYFDINNQYEFEQVLNRILVASKEGDEIVIHFEMHGLNNMRGLILKNDDVIFWQELKDILSNINLKIVNGLHISMATCFGRYIYSILDFHSTAPFKSCLSASKTINSLEIIENYSPFFEYIVKEKDVYKAYHQLSIENPDSMFYIKDTEALIENFIENLFCQYFENQYEMFQVAFQTHFDISLPDKGSANFLSVLSDGLSKYQKKYFMKL